MKKFIVVFGFTLVFASCDGKRPAPVALGFVTGDVPRGSQTKVIDTEAVTFPYDNIIDLGGEIGEVVSIERAWYQNLGSGALRLVSGAGSDREIPGGIIIEKKKIFVVPPAGIVNGNWSLHLEFTYNPPADGAK